MKSIFIVVINLVVFCSCNHQSKKEVLTEVKHKVENEWGYYNSGREFIDSLMLDVCSTSELEFVDLYPVLDSITSDQYEKLLLVDSLKNKGFKESDWGRGNWMDGPRIVNVTMSNEECVCQVDKLYHSTEKLNKYKVTERIKCQRLKGTQ